MRQPRITSAVMHPSGQVWQVPNDLTRCTFAGSTLHVFAELHAAISGPLKLHLGFADGQEQTFTAQVSQVPVAFAEDLLRVGVATRIRETLFNEDTPDITVLTRLAVEHRLISPFTHYVMVEQRDTTAAVDDPVLRQVPGMLAAGWGGAGAICAQDNYLDMPAFLRRAPIDTATSRHIEEPGFMYLSDKVSCLPVSASPSRLIGRLNADFSLFRPGRGIRLSLKEVDDLCQRNVTVLDSDIRDAFELLVLADWPEQQIVLTFWHILLEHPALTVLFNRGHRRAILRALRQCTLNLVLTELMAASLKDCTTDCWVWTPPAQWPQARQTEHHTY